MMDLIVVKNNRAFTTSILIGDGVGLEHRAVLQLIKKYKGRKIFQTSAFEMQKMQTKGRQAEFFYLTENQAIFLITLMKNSEKVLDFKESLVNAFIEYRDMAQSLAVQKSNLEWLEKRKVTKVIRRECTDVIQEFVAYAESQGSKSASKYYMNFTRMELTGLFLMEQKFPNFRDVMNIKQLNLIEVADEVISNSLKDSMEKKIPYKECFQIAKECISRLASIMPKSPLPMMLGHEDRGFSRINY